MSARPSPPGFRFSFLGFFNGWYALRADMRPRAKVGPLDALNFENEVIEWLISQRITPGKFSHIGNGNTGTGPWLPAVHDGSAICLLLKRAADVLRFEIWFPCSGITPETMLNALRAEAAITIIGPVEIAKVAYDANRRLNLIRSESALDNPAWEEMYQDIQQTFVARVKLQIDHQDWSAEQIHESWVKDRLESGWTLGPRNTHRKTHPSLLPFNRLSKVEQVKDALFRNIVAAMVPLMETE